MSHPTPRRLALVLGGGGGTRLWPISRPDRPKHLIPNLPSPGATLLQATFGRVDGLVTPDDRWIVTTTEQAPDVARATGLSRARVIREPEGRNTGPCLALATRVLLARHAAQHPAEAPPTVLILPADHFVADVAAFRRDLTRACEAAEAAQTVATLGIVPTYPATGYGYIELAPGDGDLREGAGFVEKPSIDTAAAFAASGRHLWNAGVFVAPLSALARAFAEHAAELWEPLTPVEEALRAGDEAAAEAAARRAYPTLPRVPFDVAVMERLPPPFPVVPCDAGWSDLGSWPALGQVLPHPSPTGPAQQQSASSRTVTIDCSGGVVWNEGGEVAVIGLTDVIVAYSEGRVLVCASDHAESVREAVRQMSEDGDR